MGIVFLTTLIFWGMLAGVIVLDIQSLAEKAARENPDAIFDLPDPGVWVALVILAGPFSTPVYFYKTRGMSKAIVLTLVVGCLFSGFLSAMLTLLAPMM